MTKDSILKVFTPKYHALFPVFEKSADNLKSAGLKLKILMNTTNQGEKEAIITELGKLEAKGDKIAGEIYLILDKLLIIPFDREDINRLVNRINELLHQITEIGKMTGMVKSPGIIPVYQELAEIISLSADEVASILLSLKDINNTKKKITETCRSISRLEKQAEEIFYEGVNGLFASAKGDIIHLSLRKKTIEIFLECIAQIREISESVRTIVIKAS
ncbi:MAG TPA: hypothetical protein DCY25_03020 [Bacteroidales bacterium]|nr:hypothetical protein [Bacteroidales bacterium]